MNECMVDFFRREDAEGYPFRHIHAVGKGGWEAMEQKLRELGLPKSDRLDVRQYIYDMDVVMAAADVVLCRAGASTISELTALGKPTVMVPSPYVTNNHQEKNARLLESTAARWSSRSQRAPATGCTRPWRPSSPITKSAFPWPGP